MGAEPGSDGGRLTPGRLSEAEVTLSGSDACSGGRCVW